LDEWRERASPAQRVLRARQPGRLPTATDVPVLNERAPGLQVRELAAPQCGPARRWNSSGSMRRQRDQVAHL